MINSDGINPVAAASAAYTTALSNLYPPLYVNSQRISYDAPQLQPIFNHVATTTPHTVSSVAVTRESDSITPSAPPFDEPNIQTKPAEVAVENDKPITQPTIVQAPPQQAPTRTPGTVFHAPVTEKYDPIVELERLPNPNVSARHKLPEKIKVETPENKENKRVAQYG